MGFERDVFDRPCFLYLKYRRTWRTFGVFSLGGEFLWEMTQH